MQIDNEGFDDDVKRNAASDCAENVPVVDASGTSGWRMHTVQHAKLVKIFLNGFINEENWMMGVA
ncbi:MAG: hypothetical protein K2M04_01090 [Muribaculaceae bacterium]|nr:hypothetical protein [Muribaculaceae bacterium]